MLTQRFREAASYPSGLDVESELRPDTLALLRKNIWRFGLKFDQQCGTTGRGRSRFGSWPSEAPPRPSSSLSMEMRIVSQARRSGKEVAGLETIDEHVAFWREMLERDSESFCSYLYPCPGQDGHGSFAKTRAAWMRGDVGALSTANASLRQANPGIAQRLLDRRNRRWVDRIEAEMKTGKPTTIVAGSRSLSGPGSVIAIPGGARLQNRAVVAGRSRGPGRYGVLLDQSDTCGVSVRPSLSSSRPEGRAAENSPALQSRGCSS